MPGPGGGGHSGGGGRGGFGGGFHGGAPRRPYHRPYMGGFWGFGPYYYGGGCLGGLLSAMLTPILLGIFVVIMLISVVFSGISEISQGGSVRYNEQTFQTYADSMYEEIFADTAYEDNILLVVLTEENAYDYYYIAWVGDHIAGEVQWLFGDERTHLGQAMANNISDSDYTHSLDSDLGRVVKAMAQEIREMGLPANHTCQEAHDQAPSRLYNYTDLPLTEETVNTALTRFAEITDIPCCIVVEDMETVFGRGISPMTVISLALLVIGVVLLTVSIVKKRRRRQDPDAGYRFNDRYKDPF